MCKLAAFYYFQLPTISSIEYEYTDDTERKLSFQTSEDGSLPEEDVQTPCQPQVKKGTS